MGTCEICGKTTDFLLRAEIEGTEMNVCKECSSYGKVRYVPKENKTFNRPKTVEKEELELRIVNDYANIIRGLRQKSGLTQEEFSKKVNERESLMRAIEGGRRVPSMKLAEKLERQFKVKLIEKLENTSFENISTGNKEFTLGDMIIIKKRKK